LLAAEVLDVLQGRDHVEPVSKCHMPLSPHFPPTPSCRPPRHSAAAAGRNAGRS
jgi:hypothetical protein